jgi:CheY-like chemotaxis protein
MAHKHVVLIVEDDLAAREPLEELLRQEGLDVQLASDGAEAHEHLRGGVRPCVILLDLLMPGMNGYEFRAEQMRDPALAKIPVVVLSGDAFIDEKALQLGIDDYLRKPVDADQFIAAIESHCQL